ncbi:MAG: sulfatase-like hydrolase/transferase [bacterium]|nr:sulfatase-like hydrolase/transferase [bacterium]
MTTRLSRRDVLRTMGLSVAAAVGCATSPDAAKQRPNMVFALIDDQAWNALGFSGRFPFLKTPNMDRLAREGAQFANAFVTTSLCSPSRASFLTGCYAHTHGVRTNEKLDPDPALKTFPRALQGAGYETAFVGKWHMKPTAEPRPGFDYWLSFRGQGQYKNPPLNENGREFTAEGYMTDILTDYALRWLDQPRDKPFCLLLWHKAVHGPFTPAPRHADAFPDAQMDEPPNFRDDLSGKPEWMRRAKKYGARRGQWAESEGKPVPEALTPGQWQPAAGHHMKYLRALLAVDESLGRVLDALEASGELDNTCVVFSSDNGFFLGEHGRGDKRLMYEESLRIPILVRYPPLARPGAVVKPMALNIDVAPTLLDVAGVRAPKTMQGESLLPLLKGNATRWRESFLYEYFQEGWLPGLPTMVGVRTPDWKLVHYPEYGDDSDEMYDLQADPHELANLAHDETRAAKRAALRNELERLKKDTEFTMPQAHTVHRVRVPIELALHYDFEGMTDGTVIDRSGKGHDGVCNGLKPAAGRTGSAGAFDGNACIHMQPGGEPDPSEKPFTVTAWVRPDAANGVIMSHGGQTQGFSLYLHDGVPYFTIRVHGDGSMVRGPSRLRTAEWVHVAAVLTEQAGLALYVNGERVATADPFDFVPVRPNEGLTIGADVGTPAGDYSKAPNWRGLMDDVRIYWGELPERRLRKLAKE